ERRAQTRLLESHAERRERIAGEIEGRRRRIDELTGAAATLDGEAEELEPARLIAAGEPAGRAQLNELADQVRAVALTAQSARDHLESLVREGLAELEDLDPESVDADDDEPTQEELSFAAPRSVSLTQSP